MKIKKALELCALLILATCVLFSCKTKTDDISKDDASSGDSSNTVVSENCVWSNGIAPKILLDDYSTDNLDWYSWLSSLYDHCGTSPVLAPDSDEAADHEITVGVVNRDVAKKAYRYLESDLEDFGENAEGWVIYSNGKSVAIAYDGQFAFIEAINYFNKNYLPNKSFAPDSGVIASDVFDTEEYVDELRETRRETELSALVPQIGDKAVKALKNMFYLYTDDLYKWIVDLYDPDIGGFYFSNSGRNTEGFLPDIESTAQIIGFLTTSGLISEYKNAGEAVPEEIGKKILAFAKGLQSSANGYFYHPQWGAEISTSRLGRDLGWATDMIKTFGGKPFYDTPNGMKGTLGAPEQNAATAHLTSKLSVSQVAAVSKIVAVSKASLPSYLKSLDAWKTYISGLNIPYNSYHAGNTLAAQHDQIELAGQEYIDYLINYLNSIQNPETALWESSNSGNDAYYAVNGLMKLSALYNYFKKDIPNSEAAIESCVAVILKPDGDTHVCSIYNPWITMYYMLLSAERSSGEQRVAELRAVILPKAAALIEATVKKIADYRMDDGGFAYLGREVAPANLSQSALVGCALDPESDVNATTISSVGIIANIFNVLGCDEVKLYDNNDYIVFKERWLSLGSIIKSPYMNTVVPATFDEYDPDYVTVDGGVVLDPSEYVENAIGDYQTVGDQYKWFSSAVVADPSPSAEGDLALRAETFLDNGASKTVADVASSTGFNIQGIIRNENCFVFDGDIYFERTEGKTCIGQFFFTSKAVGGDHTVSLNVLKYTANGKTYLTIGENFEGLDGVKDDKVASGIPSGEWVRLRIEVYKIQTDDGLDIKCKVYVNGKYKGTCDAGYVKEGEFADRKIAAVTYSHYRYSASVVYFDNVSVQAINKEYVQENDYTGEATGPEKIDFEDYMTYGDTTYIHAVAPASPNGNFGVQSVIGADGEETLAYAYDSNTGGADSFRLQSYGIDVDSKLTAANAFTYEADMKFDFNTEAQTTQVKVHLGSTSTSSYNAYYMVISLDKESGKLTLVDGGAKNSGSKVVTEVNNGDWFNIRIEYYFISNTEMLALTYINNKLVYVSNNYNCENTKDSSVWPVYDADGYTLPSDKQIGGVEKIMFTTLANTDVTIYLDNCIIRRCELTPPVVNEEDYTSRYDEKITDDGDDNENTEPSNPGGNTGGGSENPGGNTGGGSDDGENGGSGSTVTPAPSQGDIIDNLPNGTWKD